MFIYLRMITDNDTKKQIETTAEAYQFFFSGDINNSEGIVIDAEDEKKNKASFRISKGAGASNSYRFSSYNNGITLVSCFGYCICQTLKYKQQSACV